MDVTAAFEAGALGALTCFSIAARTLVASLPLTVSRTVLPRRRTRNGTAETSNRSETSANSSASSATQDVVGGSEAGYEEARVWRTVVICLHCDS